MRGLYNNLMEKARRDALFGIYRYTCGRLSPLNYTRKRGYIQISLDESAQDYVIIPATRKARHGIIPAAYSLDTRRLFNLALCYMYSWRHAAHVTVVIAVFLHISRSLSNITVCSSPIKLLARARAVYVTPPRCYISDHVAVHASS